MSQKLLAALKIIRPFNLIIIFASVIVAGFICSKENDISSNIILAAFSTALIAAGGYIINDYFDIEIDKINRPQRPLASGLVNMKLAMGLYFLTSAIGLLISLQINLTAFIIALTSVVLLFLYSYKLKSVLLTGNLSVAMLTGMVFIFAGTSIDNISGAILPASFALLINLIRELLKDMEDMPGDAQNNIKTFPYRFGISAAKIFLVLTTTILICFTFLPFIFKIYKIEYFILVMAVVNPIMIYFLVSIYRDHSPRNLNKLSFILKLDMIFGLTAIYFGK